MSNSFSKNPIALYAEAQPPAPVKPIEETLPIILTQSASHSTTKLNELDSYSHETLLDNNIIDRLISEIITRGTAGGRKLTISEIKYIQTL
jgi:hypothetical protein